MKNRIPRKKKKQIPKGHYCYTPTSGFKKLKNGKLGYTIKPCLFYKHVDGLEGHCSFLNSEILDQVKDCGINCRYNKNKDR